MSYRCVALTVGRLILFFFFQAEDGIRDTDRSRGLGDVYKRQDYRGIPGDGAQNQCGDGEGQLPEPK